MSELKTLVGIWKDVDRKPVRVVRTGDIVYDLVGIFHSDGILVGPNGELVWSPSSVPEWSIFKKPVKRVKHWPSVHSVLCPRDGNMEHGKAFGPFYTKENCPAGVQLLTEYPAIELEVDGE